MQFITSSLFLLSALGAGTLAVPQGNERRQWNWGASSTTSVVSSATSSSSASSSDWTATPASGSYSTSGFGASTAAYSSGNTYQGNVGNPWGSNMIEVSADEASSYEYVMQISGQNTEDWTVVFWNKYGPDGSMDGWYGYSALSLTLAAGETKYVAFMENSNGGFGAAAGSSLPTDSYGGYACTWGEFDFGSDANNGWSGFDVSAIQAQDASMTVQGMKICDALGSTCSSITTDAGTVDNAYTSAESAVGGIGGNLSSGAVRLAVTIDYSG
ncbi:putative allergen [Aspergillus brunneoviolaceus CBS 621.78]|uniref:Uncharacterized protein n=1 Tax=Aspergillus brunneoviolaceus CBS 621.78 TaxID=1450534 RepID=A0ACD1G985_9EURO|nr:hypothetical protein BO95DRAFT_442725 [Aspergillus brunneoviolaceus CBS 621.78]RAH45840.1 hypothetical protein BO95DRAFT_442725 [Aspergillus brunneoviolaceus CBS 621.78]